MDVALGSPHLGETHASRWMARESVSRLLGDVGAWERGCGCRLYPGVAKRICKERPYAPSLFAAGDLSLKWYRVLRLSVLRPSQMAHSQVPVP